MPVFLHKADMTEGNIQSPAHPLRIFCILYSGTESCFISKVPVFHKHTNNIITWAANMILLWTEFQLPGDFKYVQIILNVILGKTHPDNVKKSHTTHTQLSWTEFLLTIIGHIKFSFSLDLQTTTWHRTKKLSWNIFLLLQTMINLNGCQTRVSEFTSHPDKFLSDAGPAVLQTPYSPHYRVRSCCKS